jgi:glycosyltransferase involved in cell wall biosynthesis
MITRIAELYVQWFTTFPFINIYASNMQRIKISLITVTYNGAHTLQRCIESVVNQTYGNVEYIIIDGNSSDGTLQIINDNKKHIHIFNSEKDKGIYDALNKGIMMATGDVIGTLNSDDYFADNSVLDKVAQAFDNPDRDLFYADLDYVNEDGSVVRKWRSGEYKESKFNWGWMPPHPTFYVRKDAFKKYGLYDQSYGTAADYELMLRFMYLRMVNVFYLNEVIVKMSMGGVSNRNYINRVKAWTGDFKAMRSNHIPVPLVGVVFKPIRKIFQFI